jgi:outer membrane biogenesis lipoprotein LolB
MKPYSSLVAFLLLSACSGAKQQAPKSPKEAESTQKIEQDAKSIEQAADEAAKVIEEDARSNETAS